MKSNTHKMKENYPLILVGFNKIILVSQESFFNFYLFFINFIVLKRWNKKFLFYVFCACSNIL